MEDTGKIRDRLWMWAHDTGAHNEGWKIPKPSRMTPVEGANYMDIPNAMLIRYDGKPEMPFDQYAVPFRALDKVVWSIAGAGGATSEDERNHVLDLVKREANITGVIMDDFFHDAEGKTAISVEDLKDLRNRMKLPDRRLDMYVIIYDYQLGWKVERHIEQCDKVIFWTWEAKNLEKLSENFMEFEKAAGNKGKLLGCYLWDYGTGKPMPVESMKKQCEVGLEWLKEGRIEGMVFLATCICDLEIDAVEWTRKWIADVADTPFVAR